MVQDAITIQPEDSPNLQLVSQLLRQGEPALVGPHGERATLPGPLLDLLRSIVANLERGHSLVVMPEEQHLTTQRAAGLLGMSRPYLIRLLDQGEIPYHRVGKHRRVALHHVLAYARLRSERRSALDKMARDAFDAGLYGDTPPAGGASAG